MNKFQAEMNGKKLNRIFKVYSLALREKKIIFILYILSFYDHCRICDVYIYFQKVQKYGRAFLLFNLNVSSLNYSDNFSDYTHKILDVRELHNDGDQ